MTYLSQYFNGIGQVSGDQLETFAQTCGTLDDLRSFVGVGKIQVFVGGQSAPNDGYGGVFWWNSGSTAADDNLNVIVPPGSGTGAWNRVVQYLSIADFNVQFLLWFAGLPTTLPASAGVAWNNGNTLAVS